MREYEDQIRPAVVLRRIIIVVAVLTAVPVVLWTITAFVRSYVAPPKLPTFARLVTPSSTRETASTNGSDVSSLWQNVTALVAAHVGMPQLPSVSQVAATVMRQAPGKAVAELRASSQQPPAATPATPPLTVEARATATDAREVPAPAKDQRGGEVTASVSVAATTPPPAPSAALAAPPTKPSDPVAASLPGSMAADASTSPKLAAASSAPWPAAPQQNAERQSAAPWPAVPSTATPSSTPTPGAASPPMAENTPPPSSASSETGPSADDPGPAAQPLPGRIPLPRRRPADQVMLQITAANVPMPRPRPGAAGPVASDGGAGAPLEFLNNLLH